MEESAGVPREDGVEQRILLAIRRIIRSVDLYSHHLRSVHGVTAPQLSCLRAVTERRNLTLRGLAQAVRLSPSTVVGIVDRLEAQCLVERRRSSSDRRLVLVAPTARGRELVAKTPSPLQIRLGEALARLPAVQRGEIARSLETVVDLLEARDLDAAPILDTASSFKGTPDEGSKV